MEDQKMKISRWTKIKWKLETTFYLLIIKFIEFTLRRLSKYESRKAGEKVKLSTPDYVVLVIASICGLICGVGIIYQLQRFGWL